MKCKYKKQHIVYKEAIDNLILYGKITIEDLPFEVRMSTTKFYRSSFRVEVNNIDNLFKLYSMLFEDYANANSEQQGEFSRLYLNKKDDYDEFIKNIQKKKTNPNINLF